MKRRHLLLTRGKTSSKPPDSEMSLRLAGASDRWGAGIFLFLSGIVLACLDGVFGHE